MSSDVVGSFFVKSYIDYHATHFLFCAAPIPDDMKFHIVVVFCELSLTPRDNFFLFNNYVTRGREPGGAPRAEGERKSTDECKQHDCDQKTFVHSKNALNWSTLKFFAIFCNHFYYFFWNINLKYEMHLAKLQNANKF